MKEREKERRRTKEERSKKERRKKERKKEERKKEERKKLFDEFSIQKVNFSEQYERFAMLLVLLLIAKNVSIYLLIEGSSNCTYVFICVI
jgi:hypothetical protein